MWPKFTTRLLFTTSEHLPEIEMNLGQLLELYQPIYSDTRFQSLPWKPIM